MVIQLALAVALRTQVLLLAVTVKVPVPPLARKFSLAGEKVKVQVC